MRGRPAMSFRSILTRRWTWTEVSAPFRRRPAASLLALGALLRVAQYAYNREFWMDENSLAANIKAMSIPELFGPLLADQLAPAGFLVAERLVYLVLGGSTLALRLVPLACGLVALVQFAHLSRRLLGPRATLVALALFAIADDLIYFASELKPYGPDVSAALAAYALADHARARGLTPRRLGVLAVAGAALVWFSFPAAFVLAAIGLVLFAGALRRRAWREAAGLVPVGLAWAGSFAGVYLVTRRQLSPYTTMWAFWDFSFPPLVPRDGPGLARAFRRVADLFVNPLSFDSPLGPRPSAVPAQVLALIGALALARRRPAWFGMLVGPIALAYVAAAFRSYPFHGRLVLFLVPGLLLLIAAGFEAIDARWRHPAVTIALLVPLLFFPAIHDVYRLFNPRDRNLYNPHGDNRPSWLTVERRPAPPGPIGSSYGVGSLAAQFGGPIGPAGVSEAIGAAGRAC